MRTATWLASAGLLLFAGACPGQPSLSGSWLLNVEKSRWGNVKKPMSVELTIHHQEPNLDYRGSVTYANEDTREFAFSGALDGKPYAMSRSFGDGTITLRRVDPLTFESTFRAADGQSTETARTSISRDGQTLTRRLMVQSPDGKKSWIEVYEKH